MVDVSIVMPFFNAAESLETAVGSVLHNREIDFELLLIDDGSTDDGAQIAESYAGRDPRVRCVRMAHGGIVAALNRGIDEAGAPIVARMDADDICLPGRFERQYAFLRDHPDISLVSCRVTPLCDRPPTEGTKRYFNWVNRSLSHEELWRDLFIESPFPHPSVMFRKITACALGGYRDYDGPEDYDLWLRMAQAGVCFAKLPDILLKWRVRANSLSRTDMRYREEAIMHRKWEHVAWFLRTRRIAESRDLLVWGAGTIGGRLWRFLSSQNIAVAGFIDIDPRKIGSQRQGLPVIGPDEGILKPDRAFVLGSVGKWGARECIEDSLFRYGFAFESDYLLL